MAFKRMHNKRKYPRVGDIHVTRRCDNCETERSIVTITIQKSWTRGDDDVIRLCAKCYDASDANPLPKKARYASTEGREEPLLSVWKMIQKRKSEGATGE